MCEYCKRKNNTAKCFYLKSLLGNTISAYIYKKRLYIDESKRCVIKKKVRININFCPMCGIELKGKL